MPLLMLRLAALALAAGLMLITSVVHAQRLEIDIVDGNAAALPIAVVPFEYLGAGTTPDTDIAAIVRANLNRSGSFRALAERDIVEKPIRSVDVNYATWRLLRQDFLVVGRLLDSPDGGYRLEFEVLDVDSYRIDQVMVSRINADSGGEGIKVITSPEGIAGTTQR